jgi:phenylpropionate dioxygenase-like ring-hydroxylating dioxygenase large terminal subunit
MLGRCGGHGFAVVEKQGMIWLWGEQGALLSLLDQDAIPICAALDDDKFVWIDVSRDMPYR